MREDQAKTDIPLESLQAVAKTLARRPYARRGVPLGNPVRIVLVDDHEILRAGLNALLSNTPDIIVVGEADGGRGAVSLVAERKPDVVLMDLEMPDGDGETATAAIVALKEPPRVLILTMHREEERLIPLLKAGVRPYVCQDSEDSNVSHGYQAFPSAVRRSWRSSMAARMRSQTGVYTSLKGMHEPSEKSNPRIGIPTSAGVLFRWRSSFLRFGLPPLG